MAKRDPDDDRDGSEGPNGEGARGIGQPEPELSEEIARRWDPDRLMRLVAQRAGKGEALDYLVRKRYETKLGVDLSHVRVVTGEFAKTFNAQRNAHAVTVGATGVILMGSTPERSMATSAGRALLAHELTHAAQAQRGLHRSARSADMPFAEEGGDVEGPAEQMEAEELAAWKGGPSKAGGANVEAVRQAEAAAKEELFRAVVERVLQSMAEDDFINEQRNGEPLRRA